MSAHKIYYLSSEVAPFSETYNLALFSRKLTNRLNLKTDVDIRVSQPKYGYVSERKYILREVIRLRDLPIIFNNTKNIINIKSSFIPDTRVQVYFIENDYLYKEMPELIYKARNGRVYANLDERFAFFNKAALDALKFLFWAPDVIICNDWQMSFIPKLLKEKFSTQEFYSSIKTIYIIHSMNDYCNFSQSSFNMLEISPYQSGKVINSHIEGMDGADLTILLNYESDSKDLYNSLKKNKDLYNKFESVDNIIIDIPSKTNKEIWNEITGTIESASKGL